MCLPLNNEGKDQGPAGTTASKIHTEGSQATRRFSPEIFCDVTPCTLHVIY